MIVPPLPEGPQVGRPQSYSWTKTELYEYCVEMVRRGFDPSIVLSSLSDMQVETLRGGVALGSSNASKNHTPKSRGSKGLTSYGKKMLRNGCWLLEQTAGVRAIGMFTGTLPPCDAQTQIKICDEWGEILRIFTQWLHRRLAPHTDKPWVLGCVEIQEKRQLKEGGLPLHCHLVFHARKGNTYIVRKEEFREAWERAIVSCVPEAEGLDFQASTRVEQCRKSVASYLSKYMSKGFTSNVARNLDPAYKMPSTWWYGVGGFKRRIKKLMVYETGQIASLVWSGASAKRKHFLYAGEVLHEHEGISFCIGVYGKVSDSLRIAIQQRDEARVSKLISQV